MKSSVAILLAAGAAFAAEPEAAEIMRRVALNQTRSLEARSRYTYERSILTRLHRSDRKLAREETKHYTIAPAHKGIGKKLTRFHGKYEKDGEMVSYFAPGYNYKDVDIDGEIADDFADDLTADEKSRDGIGKNLFPLTAEQQEKYVFTLRGREEYRGLPVYRIEFTPQKKRFGWAGEALIHAEEFQPVLVTTHLAKGIPLIVSTLFGTSVKHVGFKIAYIRLEDGVWFPQTYGGEFSVKAAFVYKRTISIAMQNSDFRKTDVQSTIEYSVAAVQ